MFDCSPLFYDIFQSTEKVLINQGGTSSSKTYSIMQLLFYKAVTEQRSVITVVGESLPNLRKGAYRDAENIFADNKYLQSQLKFWNKSERIVYFTNGSLIEFVSFENEQSAKNGKRDYLFVNEANGITYQIYWQLAIRTKNQIYIDYNPTNEFWAHTKLIGQPDTKLIISDHRHNPFLSEDDHQRIEAIKDLDLELWRVYARGLTGKIEGVIFRNWAICERIPEEAELIAMALTLVLLTIRPGL
jgi:phage terminase large subunit